MAEPTLNPALIRVVLIGLVLVITQIVRAVKTSKAAKPNARRTEIKGSGIELLRELKQQASEQARARRGELPL
jgi:hypothetical protein